MSFSLFKASLRLLTVSAIFHLLNLCSVCDGALTISSAQDFVDFSNNVNSGTNYLGETVVIDSDLDFAGIHFEPFCNYTVHFRGTLDGQGHIISNLNIVSSLMFTGIFGINRGMTVTNIVIDDSCSVESTFSSSSDTAYVGILAGYCSNGDGPCTIDSVVNLGNVSFSSTTHGNSLTMGGIVGYLHSPSGYESSFKNSVNYGRITHSGNATSVSIGGIIGAASGLTSDIRNFIENCLNYAPITHSGTTTTTLSIGGITGYSGYYAYLKNCLSVGKITILNAPSTQNIGGISGRAENNANINSCYFTKDTNADKKYGYSYSITESSTPSTTTAIDSSLMNSLNVMVIISENNKWLLNLDNVPVTFKVNNNKGFTVSTQMILFPDLSDTAKTFKGWYNNSDCKNSFDSLEISSAATLYGLYGTAVTVTLNANGGDEITPSTMKVAYSNAYGIFPTPTRTGYSFLGWFTAANGGEKIESTKKVTTTSAHSIYAQWKMSSFELTFEFGNGTAAEVKRLEYDSEIVYPSTPTKQGYTFSGWDITATKMPMNDLKITAQWLPNTYTVSFNGNKGVTLQQSKNVTYDSTYGELPSAERTGYTFGGWFADDDEGAEIKSDTVVEITGDQTLYAHWIPNTYTITFEVNGGDSLSESASNLTFDTAYGKLPEPTRTGYTFLGWFTEKDGGEQITNETKVATGNNHQIYAHWSVNRYTIAFEAGEGSECESINQDYNTEIVLPEPTKTGYTFEYWCEDPELTTKYTGTTIPAEDKTLYAKYIANSYAIVFVFNNGADPDVGVLKFNETIVYPKNVEKREGYTFSGWDNDIERMPANDLIIRAQWAEDAQVVEIVLGDTNMNESEVNDLLGKYTKSNFTISKFEYDNSAGTIQVIIKFNDHEEANDFADKVKDEIEEGKSIYIRDVKSTKKEMSYSLHLCPVLAYTFILHSIF